MVAICKGQTCAYRLESYWTYELCHGRFLRQYHEERDGKEVKVQEYFLGHFSSEKMEKLLAEEEKDKVNDITRHPPTKVDITRLLPAKVDITRHLPAKVRNRQKPAKGHQVPGNEWDRQIGKD